MEALVGFPKREVQTISLIGFAHLLSHVYMLALAPLAPSLIKDLNITAVDWGVVLAVFAIFTGIFQKGNIVPITISTTTLVCFDYGTQKPMEIPNQILEFAQE